jgi:hypothetical protein
MEISQERIEAVAKKVGFVGIIKYPHKMIGHPSEASGLYVDLDFPENIAACFKRLVPGRVSEIGFMFYSDCISCDLEDLNGNFFEGHVKTETIEEAWTKSALVFFLAFEKLVESKE